jgi:hypothetical protein
MGMGEVNIVIFFVFIGFLMDRYYRMYRVKTNYAIWAAVYIIGFFLLSNSDGGFLRWLGVFLLFLPMIFLRIPIITKSKKNAEAEYKKILIKAKSRLLNDKEAFWLLREAKRLEISGEFEEAKVLYELLLKSGTPASDDARSCLEAMENTSGVK